MHTPSPPSRDLGRLGENAFTFWCTGNGLSATGSNPDRMGWDVFVEFEPEIDPGKPLDRQRPLKKMLVQVKSTDGRTPRIRAKLSALKRLVDADLPAFVAALAFDGSATPRSARLLHIGRDQIDKILKEVRTAEQKGRFDLHNIWTTLSLKTAKSIALDGSNVGRLLQEPLPENIVDYVRAKDGLRSTCGYDETSIRAHFDLAKGHRPEALADLLIGKVPELEIATAQIDRRRFDISLDKDIDRFSSGLLRVDVKSLQRGKLIATSEPRSRAEVEIDIYTASVPGPDADIYKARFANSYVELVLDIGSGRAQLTFETHPEQKRSIDECATLLAFANVLSRPGATLEVNLGASTIGPIEAPKEARQLSSLALLSEFVDTLNVAMFRHRKGSHYETTILELRKILDNNFNMFSILVRPGLAITAHKGPDWPLILPAVGSIYAPLCIEFGPYVYTAIICADLARMEEPSPEDLRVIGAAPRVIEDQILDRGNVSLGALNERASALAFNAQGDGRFTISTVIADG